VQFEIHSQGAARLWTYAEQDEYTEWLLPIAFKQKSVGFIALSGKNLITTASDQLALQSICGILGLALQQSDQKQLSAADESALVMLTPREREIFALLPSGLSNPELGAKLGIASGTVKIHVERILSKLNLRDRTQAAVRAVELGYRST
jgi:DNA-binding NarL/FixJ family response regulator